MRFGVCPRRYCGRRSAARPRRLPHGLRPISCRCRVEFLFHVFRNRRRTRAANALDELTRGDRAQEHTRVQQSGPVLVQPATGRSPYEAAQPQPAHPCVSHAARRHASGLVSERLTPLRNLMACQFLASQERAGSLNLETQGTRRLTFARSKCRFVRVCRTAFCKIVHDS
jgi:hypothetical protein